jgi:hypothetical protein
MRYVNATNTTLIVPKGGQLVVVVPGAQIEMWQCSMPGLKEVILVPVKPQKVKREKPNVIEKRNTRL